MRDAAPAVRLRAACATGEDGFDALESLVVDEAVEVAIRVDAFQEAIRKLPAGRRHPLLLRALQADASWVLVLAVRALRGTVVDAEREGAALRALLQPAGLSSGNADLRREIALALGARPSAETERTLLALLADDDPDVGLAGVEALGEAGTAAAVEPLIALRDRLFGGELATAAARAIERIQARLPAAAPGQLALTGSDARDGAISLSGEPGALSVVARTQTVGAERKR